MKFRAPKNKPDGVYLALTSSHTFVIPAATAEAPHGVDVPQRFHRHAVAEGCLPEGVPDDVESDHVEDTKPMLIERAIRSMLDNPQEGDFTGDGKPNVTKLSAKCGFNVSAGERDAAWAAIADDGED